MLAGVAEDCRTRFVPNGKSHGPWTTKFEVKPEMAQTLAETLRAAVAPEVLRKTERQLSSPLT